MMETPANPGRFRDVGVYIRQTLYILAKNTVEALNKELDKENGLKIALSKDFK
jgi:hypothetical protein